jgi:hypothetical protein
MAVHELYSKRRKRERGEMSDVYAYDAISDVLRKQIVHIWYEVLGHQSHAGSYYRDTVISTYHKIVQVLRREYGTFTLTPKANFGDRVYSMSDLTTWFLSEKDAERVLDAIELTFSVMATSCSHGYLGRKNAASMVEAAIAELNIRFRENGVGYEYVDGKIIRVDSRLIHVETVVPALSVLHQAGFENAKEEFMNAFEHYRHGNKPEALIECCKCFESTMKVICTKRGWHFDSRASAKELLDVCLTNGLIPSYWQSHLSGLRSILESAIPTPRNKQAGHGAGPGPAHEIPSELVAYVLHMTAATVLFLADAEKSLP